MTASIVQTQEKDLSKFALSIQGLAQGRSNAVGSVTLNANQTTTTVAAPNCGDESKVFLFPQTANAAAVVASTYILSTNITPAQFIITHASNANADKTFSYVCLG